MAKRPKSALPGGKRAVTDFAKMAAYHNGNIRYKVKTNLSPKSSRNSKCFFFLLCQAENILLVELDMPNRTTRDYEGPTVAPKIQAALDAALMDEEDIDLDANDIK